ncbi:MAG: hypothetical protein WCR55_01215 [Lentisphaerota bacterium]
MKLLVMIEKIVKKVALEHDEIKENLEYWLSRTPAERVEAIEILRKQYYGNTERLQRFVRVIRQA